MIENSVVVEIKIAETIADVHIARILACLKLSKLIIGLIINFNVLKLTDGIRRLIAST